MSSTISDKNAIQIRDLHKTYRIWYRREKVEAVRGINLDVERGEIFGFLGPNGAGKTTTVKMLLGLLRPCSGSINILGGSPGDLDVKQRIGYMPERSLLPTYLRLEEMVSLFGSLSGLKGRRLKQAVETALKNVNLLSVADRTLDTFSKGMLQRATLAQALVAEPELLLLDEPAIGLDPVARHQLRELLQKLREQGKTIFLNSHELEVVQMICDRFAILDQGQILAIEPIKALSDFGRYVIELGSSPIEPEILKEKITLSADWDPQQHTLSVDCGNLTNLNRTIDELRQLNIEIISINPYTISLEQLFLRYVASNAKN